MFSNIGSKIKKLSQVICILGMIVSLIGAIVLWVANDKYNPTIFSGILTLVGGCLASWIGSFFTYGFGELVEQATYARVALDRIANQKSSNI